MVNTGIWALAMIALVFGINDYPGAEGKYPILGGGMAVSITLITATKKIRVIPGLYQEPGTWTPTGANVAALVQVDYLSSSGARE
jgi:hypothetical protein